MKLKNFLIPTALLLFASATVAGAAAPAILSATILILLFQLRRRWDNPAQELSLNRCLTRWTAEHQKLFVSLRLRNAGRKELHAVTLTDRFVADREPDKSVKLPYRLDPGETVPTGYRVECRKRRGRYMIGPMKAQWQDPLGLFDMEKEFPRLSPLTVVPETSWLEHVALKGRPRWDAFGRNTERKAGNSLNFFGTREYRAGDTLRFIHWPSVARTGKLIVREFEVDTATEVTLFLDLHYKALKGFGRETTLEYAIRMAASIAAHAIGESCRVQMLAHGTRPVYVPSGGGPAHLAGVLEALTSLRADGDVPFPAVLDRSGDIVSSGSTAVLLFNTSQLDLGEYIDAITTYRAKGVKIIAVIIDDSTFLNLWEGVNDRTIDPELLPEVVRLLMTQGVTTYTIARSEDIAERFSHPYMP